MTKPTLIEVLNMLDERLKEEHQTGSITEWSLALDEMRKLLIKEINKTGETCVDMKTPKPTKSYQQMNDFLDEIEKETSER